MKRERSKRLYDANRDKINQRRRELAEANKGVVNEKRRSRYSKNPEVGRRATYKYRQNNPIKATISTYKHSAKKRNYVWKLEESEAAALLMEQCHYCGLQPSPTNGIDRKDNDVGYIKENCVAACAICNRAKSDMPYEEFKAYINRIAEKYRGIVQMIIEKN